MDKDFTPKSNYSLLSPGDLASFLGISKISVYRLISSRKIPFYKISRSIRFKKEEVEEYLEKNRVKSSSEFI